MSYKKTPLTMNEYIDIRKDDIARIHTKAMNLLEISHGTWKSRRDTGEFKAGEMIKLAEDLFEVNLIFVVNLCVNSYNSYYKTSQKLYKTH